jgi:hypothetical protein
MFSHTHRVWLRIAGQAIAFLSLVFVLLFLIGEGMPDTGNGEGKELLFFLPFFVFTIIGYVLAYFFPARGAGMLIGGGVLMMCYQLLFANYSTALIFGLPFVIAGALTLVAIKKPGSKSIEEKVPAMEH